MNPASLAQHWFLTGPTASGKTAVGIALAKRIDGEIISLDSMAVYRGMDVGTAKPTPRERQQATHHLIDICEPHESFSVARYAAAACDAAAFISSRGRQVIFVGGTPLYLKAILRGMFVGPQADWQLRGELAELAQRAGTAELHRRLALIDPQAAARLHGNDERRLIRALEVHAKTGRPISELQREFAHPRPGVGRRVFALEWPVTELRERIDGRVDTMFHSGMVDEVKRLLALPRGMSRTARQALGYREVIEHLEGLRSLDETIALVKLRTRQMAKRQLTWLRSLEEVRPIAVAGPLDVAHVAATLAAEGQ